MPVLASIPINHPGLTRRITDWADQTQVHRAVMSLFPENLPGDQRERRAGAAILYRIDTAAGCLLVQAARPPVRTDHGIQITDLGGLLPRLVDRTISRRRRGA